MIGASEPGSQNWVEDEDPIPSEDGCTTQTEVRGVEELETRDHDAAKLTNDHGHDCPMEPRLAIGLKNIHVSGHANHGEVDAEVVQAEAEPMSFLRMCGETMCSEAEAPAEKTTDEMKDEPAEKEGSQSNLQVGTAIQLIQGR